MKRFTLLVVSALVCEALHAQIPNPGFEQWTGGIPNGWISFGSPVPGAIQQSATARSGSFAVRGNVVDFMGNGFSPFLIAGPDGEGFPVTQRHANLTGYYRFTSVSGDVFIVSVGMFRAGQVIGAGSFIGTVSQTSYTPFIAPIFYGAGGNPDTCYIQFFIADSATGLVNPGSFFLLDDLAFSGINAVRTSAEIPSDFVLKQNYPNPFNPSTRIEFSLPRSSFATLKVYDLLGKEVATLASEELDAGNYNVTFDASNLPSGTYFYTLRAGDFAETKRLLVIR